MSNDRKDRLLFVPPSTQDHRQGLLSATVVLVMYGDYQCSQSADVYQLIKVIGRQLNASFDEDYLCFIFRHFPQVQIHSRAQRAAEAAQAAAVQGQFWQMHDILFIHQQELGDGYLVEYANNLRLDICQFLRDMFQHVHLDRINQDIESGYKSGVTAAPAYVQPQAINWRYQLPGEKFETTPRPISPYVKPRAINWRYQPPATGLKAQWHNKILNWL